MILVMADMRTAQGTLNKAKLMTQMAPTSSLSVHGFASLIEYLLNCPPALSKTIEILEKTEKTHSGGS